MRSSRPELFLGKHFLKICSKFTGEHLCRSAISIKLLCNFLQFALWYGCSPVNLLHIFKIYFPKNTSGWLLLVNYSCGNLHITCLTEFWMPKLWMQYVRNVQNVRIREKCPNTEFLLATYLEFFHSMMFRMKILEIENIEMSSLWVLNMLLTWRYNIKIA